MPKQPSEQALPMAWGALRGKEAHVTRSHILRSMGHPVPEADPAIQISTLNPKP